MPDSQVARGGYWVKARKASKEKKNISEKVKNEGKNANEYESMAQT